KRRNVPSGKPAARPTVQLLTFATVSPSPLAAAVGARAAALAWATRGSVCAGWATLLPIQPRMATKQARKNATRNIPNPSLRNRISAPQSRHGPLNLDTLMGALWQELGARPLGIGPGFCHAIERAEATRVSLPLPPPGHSAWGRSKGNKF